MASLTTDQRTTLRKTRTAWTQSDTAVDLMHTRNTRDSTDETPIVSIACSIHSTGVLRKNVALANSRRCLVPLTQYNVHLHRTVHCDSRTKYQGTTWLVHERTSRDRSQLQSGCVSLCGLPRGFMEGGPQRKAHPGCGQSIAKQHPLTMTKPDGLPPSVPCDDGYSYTSVQHKFSPIDSCRKASRTAIRTGFRRGIEQFTRRSQIVGRAGPPPPPC